VAEVFRDGKFVVRIYSNDHPPAHVHVCFDGCVVRVLITKKTVTRGTTDGKPNQRDIRRALEVVAGNLDACIAKWKELYG
jgi:hypothetical protein